MEKNDETDGKFKAIKILARFDRSSPANGLVWKKVVPRSTKVKHVQQSSGPLYFWEGTKNIPLPSSKQT